MKFLVLSLSLFIGRKSTKRVRKVNHSDGTFEEMHEDEVLFEKTNEDPMIVAIASAALSQANSHNITILNEKCLDV